MTKPIARMTQAPIDPLEKRPATRRILYVEANEDGTVGGSHKILFDFSTRITAPYRPVVLFYQDNLWADRLRDQGVEVVTWDSVRADERAAMASRGKVGKATALLKAIALRRTFIRDQGIDLVHLNNSPLFGYDDWLPATRIEGIPCVVYGMGGVPRVPNPLRRALIRSFDAYFPLSRLVEAGLRGNGVQMDKVVLTYPGVDLQRRDPMASARAGRIRQRLELGDDRVLAVMVGNIRRWKGQHVVIEALAGLSSTERGQLRMLFVGEAREVDRAYMAELESAVRHHHLDTVVEFTGRRDDVPDLLEAADVAIHASVRPEPFGLVVQEAMLHGCAIVAANTGGPTEMVTEKSGILFDVRRPSQLQGHLRDLIHDPARRARLGAAARLQARSFDVRRHVALIEARYEQLLA